MSMTDLDFATGSDYKTFRQTTRDRLLHEMIRSTKTDDSKATWKVLIMDKVTVKVLSSSCKMAEITDEGVSLVEDLYKRRQPLPSMDAIYFIQPSKENVIMILSDMSGRCPLYRKAFVFFSTPIAKELIGYIKNDSSIIPRIGGLREVNLEFFPFDTQGFVTDHDTALDELFGEVSENSNKFNECINTIATRIATAFASLKELPRVRYRAAKSSDLSSKTAARELVPTKLANALFTCLSKYKTTIPDFPQKETCDLLIVDRTVDLIAPVIHEWTYDAMIHDLLEMDGNKYMYEVPGKAGSEPEKKEALLEDTDPVWLELRHAHIADASERLSDKMANFVSKNKAVQLQQNARDGAELSTKDLQKMVQALPQYNEQKEKLSIHVEIAGQINKTIRDIDLRGIGQLEQDLVFGDAGSKEVINFLRSPNTSQENKLRVLMIYAAVYPDKFVGDNGTKLMQLAKLSPEDIHAINNLRVLGGLASKKSSGSGFSLKFEGKQKKQAARQDKVGEEEGWALSRFFPMIEDLTEKLNKGDLSKDDYPCMNDPSVAAQGASQSAQSAQSAPARTTPQVNPNAKSRRTPTWARRGSSDDGHSSDSVLRHPSTDFKNMGQRIFIFIIGGATRSELRAAHKLSPKLRREVVLGSTSLDDPSVFLTKLRTLKGLESSLAELGV